MTHRSIIQDNEDVDVALVKYRVSAVQVNNHSRLVVMIAIHNGGLPHIPTMQITCSSYSGATISQTVRCSPVCHLHQERVSPVVRGPCVHRRTYLARFVDLSKIGRYSDNGTCLILYSWKKVRGGHTQRRLMFTERGQSSSALTTSRHAGRCYGRDRFRSNFEPKKFSLTGLGSSSTEEELPNILLDVHCILLFASPLDFVSGLYSLQHFLQVGCWAGA